MGSHSAHEGRAGWARSRGGPEPAGRARLARGGPGVGYHLHHAVVRRLELEEDADRARRLLAGILARWVQPAISGCSLEGEGERELAGGPGGGNEGPWSAEPSEAEIRRPTEPPKGGT